MRSLKLSNVGTGWCLDGWPPWDRRKGMRIFFIPSLISCGVTLKSANRCFARQSIQIWKRWQGRQIAIELSSSMLAPCDLLAGRGDSLGPKILSQRWLGLATLGGKISSWADKMSDAHGKSCHWINAERRMQPCATQILTPITNLVYCIYSYSPESKDEFLGGWIHVRTYFVCSAVRSCFCGENQGC